MSARTVAETLDPAEALAFVRDVLKQTDEAPVLRGLFDAYPGDVLRVVGLLGEPASGARYSLFGIVGFVTGQGKNQPWIWNTTPEARRWTKREGPIIQSATAPTREAADAALCDALRALGWHCLQEAP